jgi:hypothetical protein
MQCYRSSKRVFEQIMLHVVVAYTERSEKGSRLCKCNAPFVFIMLTRQNAIYTVRQTVYRTE